MKVFVLMGYINYEGYTFLGVYASREAAETAKLKAKGNGWDGIDIEESSLLDYSP